MTNRILALLLLAVGLFGVAAVACTSEDPAPVRTQEPQTASGGTPVYLPQTARDGPAGTFHYTVVAGDTVFSLAQRFGTTVANIVELNGLDDAGAIEVGQVLIMPLAPTATPTATATPTRTPTTQPTGPSQLISHGPRGTNQVALTFDMGGRVEPALDIMNYLINNRIPATIFMTGSMVDNQNTDAGRQVVALVEANQDLFDFGNHSYSHPDFTTLSAAGMAEEIHDAEDAFARYSDLDARPYFRPPFGAYDSAVLAALGPLGYTRSIYWDVDTIDWLATEDGGPTAASMTTKVVNNAQGGSIVLMHLGGYHTYEALPGMIAGLRANGLEPVKLSTMLD